MEITIDLKVAILYSSSQNSLFGTVKTIPLLHFGVEVAILYSSSQNSLGLPPYGCISKSRTPCTGGRNPLFIKSEFSLGGEQHLDDNSILSQSFIHQVRILSRRELRGTTATRFF